MHTVGECSSQYAGYVSQRISSWSCTQCGRLTDLRDSELRNQACRPTAPAAISFAHNVWDVQNMVESDSAQQSLVHLGSGASRILSKSSRSPSFIHQSSSKKMLCRSGILSKQVRNSR